MRRSKKYKENLEKVDRTRQYGLGEGIQLLKTLEKSAFDETVEIALKLGLDTRHSDQQVRGAVVLPYGTGKTVKVLVLTKGEQEREAEEAGGGFVGVEGERERAGGGEGKGGEIGGRRNH